MNKQEIKLIKAYINLNEYISQDKKQLYDRLDNLKLSHNRKTKALKTIQEILENYPMPETEKAFKEKLLKLCDDALFSNGRMKMKPFSYSKAWKEYKDRNPFNTWIKEQNNG